MSGWLFNFVYLVKYHCFFPLTYTQKKQTWHKKGRKSSIAISTSHIPHKTYRNAFSIGKPFKMKTTIKRSSEKLAERAMDNDLLKFVWHKKGRKSSIAISTSHIPHKTYRNAFSIGKPFKMKTTIKRSSEKLAERAMDNDLLKFVWI